ncbi:Ribosomal protein S14 [Halalkaliarchaeum sp. AArc-CO]|uniref:30S ribosomal protein S14 n=1 Tax=unclassified Halalkaliarchaeum TaxID=2678344 RepID=UPI00217D4859|nr:MULTISPECIES: 30S ribosomal protein S14 [unclassified Halalkaliarchaeum]MDR5673299.1 30S ribosomal protein S14 [Halalkaliarchaeum sp. AArc-GB]UWG51740.1 Ribosomal protein S14 [Halalkaliarchaeum sp. AArc-CO]
MSESEPEPEESADAAGEHATRRTGQRHECRRCGRKQGLVGKYDINLCRQCFREVARDMGFKKYS